MNFFENQDRARKNTQQLISLFVLSVLCIIITIYVVLVMIFKTLWWNPQLFLTVAICTSLVIGYGSWCKTQALKQGGGVIARNLGGRLIIAETARPNEQLLLNVVEEMAIASGTVVPPVYVLENERGINAFAAGYTGNDAVIGVTRGCLEQLSRNELQGVIGHEFSHILNGDMCLNLRLLGLLHGILFIFIAGRLLLNTRCRTNRENSIWWLGIALMVIGSIGLLCGRLIKSAISRQREFLADASAAQFTRNPVDLAAALDKIAYYHYGSALNSPHAEEHSHLFFSNALQFNFLEDLFATHPPLEQRIRRLQARAADYAAPKSAPRTLQSQDLQTEATLASGLVGIGKARTVTAHRTEIAHKQVIDQVSTVAPEDLAHAQDLLLQLPEPLQIGIQEPQSAMAIVYGLLLYRQSSEVRLKQVEWLRRVESSALVERTLELSTYIERLEPRTRLPFLDLTVPVLRQNVSQCQQLFKCIHGLAKIDGHWSISEFVLHIILWHRLQTCISPTVDRAVQYTNIEQVWSECVFLLSAVAQAGHNTSDNITYAFRSGLFRLPKAAQQPLPEVPPVCNFGELKRSLDRLSAATPKLKQAIVNACAYTVLLDNSVSIQEAELLRAVAIALDCPLPQFLNSQQSGSKYKTA